MTISPHVNQLVTSLSPATSQLLRELRDTKETDSLLIRCAVHEDGDNIRIRQFLVTPQPAKGQSWHDLSRAIRSEWWRRVPDSRPHSSAQFACPASDTSALVILAAVGRSKIEFADELSRTLFFTSVMRFARMQQMVRVQAEFKLERKVPEDAPKGTATHPPMPHQRAAAHCASKIPAYALLMEQSTGKTYTTIMAIEAIEREACGLHLIVAPKNVGLNWKNELHEFSSKRTVALQFKGLQFDRTRVLLEALRLRKSGDFDNVYVIVSYQLAVNCAKQLEAVRWDTCIVDESHNIKSPSTKRIKAMMRLRESSTRRYILTGTPIGNSFLDLYTQLEFLEEGLSGFNSFGAFKNFYGQWAPRGEGLSVLVGMQNVPLLQERIAMCGFLIKKVEAMPDLPAKTCSIIGVELTADQRIVYERVANEIMVEIEAEMHSGKNANITANNALVRLLRLAQITSGFAVYDKELDMDSDELLPSQIERFDPNPKIEELVTYLKELPRESKAIIWCCFVQDIKQIRARLALENIDCVTFYGSTKDEERNNAVERFNKDPNCRFFIGNPAAGGVGLNLQGTHKESKSWPQKCDTVISFSQGWSSITKAQGEERPRGYLTESASPTGKRETWSIHCVDLVAENSIDEVIRQRVVDKRRHALQIQDIREILSQILPSKAKGA